MVAISDDSLGILVGVILGKGVAIGIEETLGTQAVATLPKSK